MTINKQSWLILIYALVITQLAGIFGSLFTTPKISNWYADLIMPEITPPGWLFGPAENRHKLTLGQRAADQVTKFVGSWHFIIGLFVVMAIWMSLNVIEYFWHIWDPYPFVLLNFVLSLLAAVQAPIILMSQNRTAERDRLRQEYDYYVNRRAEHGIEDIKKELKSIKYYIQKNNGPKL